MRVCDCDVGQSGKDGGGWTGQAKLHILCVSVALFQFQLDKWTHSHTIQKSDHFRHPMQTVSSGHATTGFITKSCWREFSITLWSKDTTAQGKVGEFSCVSVTANCHFQKPRGWPTKWATAARRNPLYQEETLSRTSLKWRILLLTASRVTEEKGKMDASWIKLSAVSTARCTAWFQLPDLVWQKTTTLI